MSVQFVTLPLDIVAEITVWLVGLGDLIHLAQTCSRMWNHALTSRQYWIRTPEISDIALPTGHTFKTTPVDHFYALAVRATSFKREPRKGIMTPRRQLSFEGGERTDRLDFFRCPAHSWYIDHGQDTVTIRRAEKGWEEVSCDLGYPTGHDSFRGPAAGEGAIWVGFVPRFPVEGLGTSSSYHWEFSGFKLKFQNERGPPTAPSVEDTIKILLPSFPALRSVKVNHTTFYIRSNHGRSVQVVDRTRNAGVVLGLPDKMTGWALKTFRCTFDFDMQSKIFVVGISGVDAETGQHRHKYHLANIPENRTPDLTSDASTSSEITWRNVVFEVTHSYEPPSSSLELITLPLKYPKGALYFGTFEICSQPATTYPRRPITHYGSLFLHENQLLMSNVFETENDSEDAGNHFPRRASGSKVKPQGMSKYGNMYHQFATIESMSFIDRPIQTYHLIPPVGFSNDYEWRVDAFDNNNLSAIFTALRIVQCV
ncbi:hypothetical protein SISSUDRAFT_1065989 [Sistotremastrum suecicum HHB10207 ss-3]|uniref:F-box domain-containing protein n=1 Tax=Sistotremastrum suecicum HHB10207 ss-3 TaxID=1314776 RepID=A0A165YUF8_9AGAM|nr:hypothetical protein SISSUDRAFT_1065989 [Sistotremastrum suecicum HHB10207 ss-3]